MTKSQKAFLIHNPQAGTLWQKSRFGEAQTLLRDNGFDFVLKQTAKRGDAEEFAREAVRERMDCVFVIGGDGTIHEAIQGLVGSPVILGIFPNGTGNLFAHEIGIPESTGDLSLLLGELRPQWIDVGMANGRYFALMAGIGLDALAVQGVDPTAKRWLGWWSYLYSGFFNLFKHPLFEARIEFLDPPGEGIRVKTRVIVVGNAKAYGQKAIQVATRARVDDGLLDLCVFQSQTIWDTFIHLFKVLARTHLEDKQILYFKARRFRVEVGEEIPFQLDGDLCGRGKVEFTVLPKALRIFLPPVRSNFRNQGCAAKTCES